MAVSSPVPWLLGGLSVAAFAALAARSSRARHALADGLDATDVVDMAQGAVEEATDMARKMVGTWFSLGEWVASSTARALGMPNLPDPDSERRIRATTARILDPLRVALDNPIRITSGYRSAELNKRLGGAAESQHMLGEAVDIMAPHLGTWQATPLARLIVELDLPFDQLIGYHPDVGGHVHVSFRERDGVEVGRREVLWSPRKKTYAPWNPATQPNGQGA